MEYFREYLEKKNKENKKKLEDILELLQRMEKIKVLSYLDKNDPYLFVRVEAGKYINKALIELDLGARVFNAGNKLVFRLQQGPKGIQIGPSKTIEDQDEIEEYIEQGKSEQEAYNEIFRQIPKNIKNFLRKVHDNINNRVRGKTKIDMDEEKYKQILNSILTAEFFPSFKM